MRSARLPGAVLVVAFVVTACTTGAGGGDAGATATATSAPAASVVASASPSLKPAPASTVPSAGGGGYGGTKGDYATSSPAAAGSTTPETIRLSGFAFDPTTMSVAAGASVTFSNEDGVAHDIVEGTAGTPVAAPAVHVRLAPGATSTVTLSKPGTLTLTCTIHPSMTMTLTVGP